MLRGRLGGRGAIHEEGEGTHSSCEGRGDFKVFDLSREFQVGGGQHGCQALGEKKGIPGDNLEINALEGENQAVKPPGRTSSGEKKRK